jgi:hypothetical protein
MPLPTMSLRASPEYHQLIRDVATALRTRPQLADVLRDVLQVEHGVTKRDTNVLQAFQERLMIHSDALQRVTGYADNINERLKVLEQPEALRDTNVLQSILDRLAALEQAIAGSAPSQPPKTRSRGRARSTKGPVKSLKAIAGQGTGEGQQHLTLEQTRQIDEMLKAGRSAEEIMKVTGRPIPTREEIKQRLLDEISPSKSRQERLQVVAAEVGPDALDGADDAP